MKRSNLIKSICGLIAIVGAVVLYLSTHTEEQKRGPSPSVASDVELKPAVSDASTRDPEAPGAVNEVDPELQALADLAAAENDPVLEESVANLDKEVLATRQMILAHEPLRKASVADPDSEENQRVLQQMVGKALASAPAKVSDPNQ